MSKSLRVLVVASIMALAVVPASAGVQAQTEVIATIDVGDRPIAPVVNPFTDRVYVPTAEGTVWVIHGDRVVASIPVAERPDSIAINPTNNQVYVGHALIGQVTIIDGNTNTVVATPTTDLWPVVSVNPVTNRVIAGSAYGIYVSFIEDKDHDVRVRYAGQSPRKPGIDLLTNRVYVPVFWDGFVRVFDGSSLATVAIIPTASGTTAVAVNPFTDRVYAALYHCPGGLAVIDGQPGTLLTSLAVNDDPCPAIISVTVNPLTNRVYATARIGELAIVDGDTNTVMANIPVSGRDIALDALSDRVYIESQVPRELLVIDGQTASVAERVAVDCQTTSVVVNPITNRVYAPCFHDDKVLVLQADSAGLPDVAPAAELAGRILDLVIDLSGQDHQLVSGLQTAATQIEDGEIQGALRSLVETRARLRAKRGLEMNETSGPIVTLDQIILLMIGHY